MSARKLITKYYESSVNGVEKKLNKSVLLVPYGKNSVVDSFLRSIAQYDMGVGRQ